MDWKLLFKSFLVLIFFILLLCIEQTFADVTSTGSKSNTQSNSTGTNTLIDTYESATTYQSGSSSNTTTNNDTNNSSNTKTAVNTASAPSMSVYSQSSCTIPLSLGMTTIGFSFSAGNYYVDEACERRKKSELLNKLGMKVASISIMCLDYDVWISMKNSGSSCPIDGLIGKQAEKRWEEVGGFYRKKEKKYNNKSSMIWND